jgi:hypothetical protein
LPHPRKLFVYGSDELWATASLRLIRQIRTPRVQHPARRSEAGERHRERPRPREFHPRSELFNVRVWREDLGAGRIEWSGKVEHRLSGETRYFRDWQVLLDFLQEVRTEDSINRREELPLNKD